VTGVTLASLVGVAELAVGLGAAYAAYQMVAHGVPLWDALHEAEQEIVGREKAAAREK
jgi:deferrochelatase/peroxidase EfeB